MPRVLNTRSRARRADHSASSVMKNSSVVLAVCLVLLATCSGPTAVFAQRVAGLLEVRGRSLGPAARATSRAPVRATPHLTGWHGGLSRPPFPPVRWGGDLTGALEVARAAGPRSEEHTSELQSRPHLVFRLLLAK